MPSRLTLAGKLGSAYPSGVDGVCAAHAQSKVEHFLAHAVTLLGERHQSLAYDMESGLVWNEQAATEEIGFRFYSAIVCAFTLFRKWRRTFVT